MRHPTLTRIDALGNQLVDALSIPQNAGVVVAFFRLVLLKNRRVNLINIRTKHIYQFLEESFQKLHSTIISSNIVINV